MTPLELIELQKKDSTLWTQMSLLTEKHLQNALRDLHESVEKNCTGCGVFPQKKCEGCTDCGCKKEEKEET